MHGDRRGHICDVAGRRILQNVYEKKVYDATKGTEVILALSAESREKVDEMVQLATDAGGTTPNHKQDLGFMYGWGFEDLDGHLWEVIYMDPNAEEN